MGFGELVLGEAVELIGENSDFTIEDALDGGLHPLELQDEVLLLAVGEDPALDELDDVEVPVLEDQVAQEGMQNAVLLIIVLWDDRVPRDGEAVLDLFEVGRAQGEGRGEELELLGVGVQDRVQVIALAQDQGLEDRGRGGLQSNEVELVAFANRGEGKGNGYLIWEGTGGWRQ